MSLKVSGKILLSTILYKHKGSIIFVTKKINPFNILIFEISELNSHSEKSKKFTFLNFLIKL